MSDAKSQIKLFSMGAAILMTLATEVLVAYHYFKVLSGFALIALVGLGVVAWVVIWSTMWASKAGEDTKVKYTAYTVAFLVSLVMIFNGAMVIADLTLNSRASKEEAGDVARIEARGKAAAELRRAGGTWREVRELEKAHKEAATGSTRMNAPTQADVEQYQWVTSYNSLWIFFVPFAAALAGKFLLLAVIALPGGASGFLPPSGRPAPPSGPMGGGRSMESMLGGGPPRTGFTPPMPSSASRDRDGGILGGGSFPKD